MINQSGKIVVCCSTVLSVAAVLGAAAFPALQDSFWARLAGVSTETAPSGPYSEHPLLSAERAAVATTLEALSTGVPDEAELPQSGETVAAEQWSERDVAAALMECVNLLAPVTAKVVPLAPLHYDDCGTPAPVLLRSLGAKDKVAVDPPLVMNCPMVSALSRWLEQTVQPAARAAFGAPVKRIVGSSYACRNLYNLPNERRSQHAFANAMDLPVFLLADGRRVDLTQGWGPTRRDLVAKAKLTPIAAKKTSIVAKADTPEAKAAVQSGGERPIPVSVKSAALVQGDAAMAQTEVKAPAPNSLSSPQAKFLRRVHRGACEIFSTVLGPEANDVHRTHLHLDLQDRNSLNVCK